MTAGLVIVLALAAAGPAGAAGAPGAPGAPGAAEGAATTGPQPPVPNARFDYQLGGGYPPPTGVRVVSRDWFSGSSPAHLYAICYVNAFQTQPDEAGVERPDERSSWPADLVLDELGEDPGWPGEYLIDISSDAKRAQAADWVAPMVRACRRKGFEAVEFDNLDSWTRFDGTPSEGQVPFGRRDAVAYARLLVSLAHANGLAAAQKNTAGLSRRVSRVRIGFDFVVAEECGRWHECRAYREVFGRHVLAIEYRWRDFTRTCRLHGAAISVVLRDVQLSRPGSDSYRYRSC